MDDDHIPESEDRGVYTHCGGISAGQLSAADCDSIDAECREVDEEVAEGFGG